MVLEMRRYNGKLRIEAATVEVLIEKLANEDALDHEYIRTFLLTFRHFIKPIELIDLLFQR